MSSRGRARQPLTPAALRALRHEKIHARFVDLFVTRRRSHDKALRIMEKEFFLTARTLRRLLDTPLPASIPA